ncbi:hypothetical protein [Streptomyces sp. NPDC006324]|uniref:hypothetical protein n=1 Tax=Streptomyces sp. NPDC006324 TaxID=3156751 RepID=UPI0033BF791A
MFEAWAARPDPALDRSRSTAPVKALQDLGLTLVPSGGRRPRLRLFEDCTVRIDGSEARFRY